MRKREREEAAEAARRRLTQLGIELGRIGAEEPSDPVSDHRSPSQRARDEVLRRPEPLRVEPDRGRVPAAPGRHARARRHRDAAGWVEDRLPTPLRGRLHFTAQHGVVILGLLGVALALAGWFALRAEPEKEAPLRASLSTPGESQTGLSPSAAPSAASDQPSPRAGGTSGRVVVDVSGKVRRPGIVTLPAGSRVEDALRKAGGARPGTALSSLNRARVLVDGEQILVGRSAPASGAASAAGSAPEAGALVNLNAAGLSELDSLPGVGPVTAQKILDWRTSHGAFSSVDELLEVDGIGDKTLADIAPHVTL